jgi:hypothetical protein
MTLLQSINQFVENICVTDRQEGSIKTSLDNIYRHLTDDENDLALVRVFTNGSYDRDTIIRPLDDIDIFAVLKREDWENEFKQLPKPQAVLTAIKKYLDGISEYEGKVKQDRPCVTIRLSDKNFDILPSFPQAGGGYLIPNYDLNGWTDSYPERLYEQLEGVHRLRNYKVKQVIKAVKQWNRGLDKLIPSYHIEEVAINIFNNNDFKNYREGIECWFRLAEYHLTSAKMKKNDDYASALEKIKAVAKELDDAAAKCEEGKESEAVKIWKEIFGEEFPMIDPAEAKNFARAISEGGLKVASTGILSTTDGYNIGASSGYHGDLSKA